MLRTALTTLVVLALPGTAHADFARPPDGYYDHYEPREPPTDDEDGQARSTVRLFTGPALRFAEDATRGGLLLALDAGARGAGARFSGAWLRAGSDRGLAAYSAELWADFAENDRLHPILAAGAAVARLDRGVEGPARIQSDTIGVALLRATLQYRLPVDRVDARAALDVTGSVPAVGAQAAATTPWVTAALTVGVGF